MILLLVSFLIAGCSTSSHYKTLLTPEQAKVLAQQLANDKAFAEVRCQPFHEGPEPRLEQGRWIWKDRKPYGQLELEANVVLAADGSTNQVKLMRLDFRSPMW